jgi:hypothetical protein
MIPKRRWPPDHAAPRTAATSNCLWGGNGELQDGEGTTSTAVSNCSRGGRGQRRPRGNEGPNARTTLHPRQLQDRMVKTGEEGHDGDEEGVNDEDMPMPTPLTDNTAPAPTAASNCSQGGQRVLQETTTRSRGRERRGRPTTARTRTTTTTTRDSDGGCRQQG